MSDKNVRLSDSNFQGWKQVLYEKKDMLYAFDKAKSQDESHKVKTYRGKVAESEFRKWLSNFLPKKYGVTSGYIISQGVRGDVKTPHFDVIIYDQLESPVLWTENHHDTSLSGSSRAIPAEHVKSVIEVKSSFRSETVKEAVKHLRELKTLLNVDDTKERLKKYLPAEFFSAIVFFELKKDNEFNSVALDYFVSLPKELRGFFKFVILRGDGLLPEKVGYSDWLPIIPGITNAELEARKQKKSLLTNGRGVKNGEDHFVILHWNEMNFSMFAFDIVALLNGTYHSGKISSLYGFCWELPFNINKNK